jgi:hypothetical protein
VMYSAAPAKSPAHIVANVSNSTGKALRLPIW